MIRNINFQLLNKIVQMSVFHLRCQRHFGNIELIKCNQLIARMNNILSIKYKLESKCLLGPVQSFYIKHLVEKLIVFNLIVSNRNCATIL